MSEDKETKEFEGENNPEEETQRLQKKNC